MLYIKYAQNTKKLTDKFSIGYTQKNNSLRERRQIDRDEQNEKNFSATKCRATK